MKAFIFCCFCVSAFTSFSFLDMIIGGFACLVFCKCIRMGQGEERHGGKDNESASRRVTQHMDANILEDLTEINPATGLIMQPDARIDTGGNLYGISNEGINI